MNIDFLLLLGKSYRASQHGTKNVKTHIRTTQKTLSNEQIGPHQKSNQILPRRRYPPCYSYIQSIRVGQHIPSASAYGVYGSHQKFLASIKDCFEKENHRVKGS